MVSEPTMLSETAREAVALQAAVEAAVAVVAEAVAAVVAEAARLSAQPATARECVRLLT